MTSSAVDLIWLPLGAGDNTGLVRRCGRAFEALSAYRQRRGRNDLYHSALEVHLDGQRYAIEMTPAWGMPAEADRGVVGTGPVVLARLGRLRLFRYEIHAWVNGLIVDAGEAVGAPQRLSTDREHARSILELLPEFPTRTWGRDEQGTGDMWNSNSLTSWLLARSGHYGADIRPPENGRAPGWLAGLTVAGRELRTTRN